MIPVTVWYNLEKVVKSLNIHFKHIDNSVFLNTHFWDIELIPRRLDTIQYLLCLFSDTSFGHTNLIFQDCTVFDVRYVGVVRRGA